jgi:hypothetical protein
VSQTWENARRRYEQLGLTFFSALPPSPLTNRPGELRAEHTPFIHVYYPERFVRTEVTSRSEYAASPHWWQWGRKPQRV